MRRERGIGACVLVCVLLLAGIARAEEQQWLQYRTATEPYRVLGGYVGGRACEVTAEAPEGVSLPKLTGAKPLFAKWVTPMVKAGFLWVALDQSKKQGPHDRLYVDLSGDGGLADESPVEARGSDADTAGLPADYERTEFGPVKVLFKGDDGPVTYHLNVKFYSYQSRTQLYLAPAGWYEGTVSLGGKEHKCRLLDYNANGSFSDVSLNPNGSDRIELDLKGDGTFTRFFVGRYLQPASGGPCFRLEVARDGASVRFTPAGELPMGTVQVPNDPAFMELTGENGHFRRRTADGPVCVPAGTYRLKYIDFKRTDGKDVKWELVADAFPEDMAFEVKEGLTTEVVVCDPVVASLTMGERERTVSFSHQLKGTNAENVYLLRSGQRPPAPKLRITNADKSYNRTFSFEYG